MLISLEYYDLQSFELIPHGVIEEVKAVCRHEAGSKALSAQINVTENSISGGQLYSQP